TGDGQSGDTGAATKRFVDAKVSIDPSGTNGITEPHTFTVTVLQNDGLTAAQGGDGVTGFTAAAGANVAVTLTDGGGAGSILLSGSLTGTTDGTGQFQVPFTSASAGTVTGHAAADVVFTSTAPPVTVTVHRETDSTHGSSGDAVKTFLAGTLAWLKVDGNNNNAPLFGATFRVTATGGTAFGNLPGSVDVTDNDSHDADKRDGSFSLTGFQNYDGTLIPLTGLAMGTYTVQEITPPPGYTLDPKVLTATLTVAAPNADLTGTPFVDTKPVLTITKSVSSAT